MKARYESRVVLLGVALFGLALCAGMLWVCWRRAEFPGPLAIHEEWVALAVADPGALLPFWTGWLEPWLGRVLFALHGPGFQDLRLLSLAATAWSLVLLTRIAGHFAGPTAGLIAAGFYASSYGVAEVRFETAGGHALALLGILQGIQLALAGWPRLGLAIAAPVALLAFDMASPILGVRAWSLAVVTGVPVFLVLGAVGALGLAGSRRAAAVVGALLVACVLLGAAARWTSPLLALLAVLAAVGLRALNRRHAGLAQRDLVMRFVLLFLAGGQLAWRAESLSHEVPTQAQRRNAVELASVVAEIEGDVWAPTRPFTSWLHKKSLVGDPLRARLLLTNSALLEVAKSPHDHALPAYPPKQNGACKVGAEWEQLWWHVRPADTKLLDRIRTSVDRPR